jgi:hypothetical protein
MHEHKTVYKNWNNPDVPIVINNWIGANKIKGKSKDYYFHHAFDNEAHDSEYFHNCIELSDDYALLFCVQFSERICFVQDVWRKLYIEIKYGDEIKIDKFCEDYKIPYFLYTSKVPLLGFVKQNAYTYGYRVMPDDLALIFIMHFGENVVHIVDE